MPGGIGYQWRTTINTLPVARKDTAEDTMTTTTRYPMHAAAFERRVVGANGGAIAPLASALRAA